MAEQCPYSWPSWMPLAQQDDYAYQLTDRRTRTDMEVGSILRVNYDTDETVVTCSLILDRSQAAWFEVFEKSLLSQGSQWFEMPLQFGGCIEWHTVRFKERPKVSRIISCSHTVYALQLELNDRDLAMCPALAEVLLCMTPEELLEALEGVRYFILTMPKFKVSASMFDFD